MHGGKPQCGQIENTMHDERLGVHVCVRLVPPAMTNQGPSVLAIVIYRCGQSRGVRVKRVEQSRSTLMGQISQFHFPGNVTRALRSRNVGMCYGTANKQQPQRRLSHVPGDLRVRKRAYGANRPLLPTLPAHVRFGEGIHQQHDNL